MSGSIRQRAETQAPKMTSEDVKTALRRRHGSEHGLGEWVCVAEAFSGFATGGGGIDLLALGVWRTAKAPGLRKIREVTNPVVAYEVKVSRADFRRELYGYTPGPTASWRSRAANPWPYKQRHAMLIADYLVFAAPAGLLKPEEIATRTQPDDGGLWLPEGCGLVEVSDSGCRVKAEADVIPDSRTLNRHEIAELIRHGIDPNRDRTVRAENARLRGYIESQNKRIDRLASGSGGAQTTPNTT